MLRRVFLPALAAGPATLGLRAASLRPSLFLNLEKLEALRTAIRTTHAKLSSAVLADADSFAAAKPPQYPTAPEKDDEQLWQREVGNKLPFLAIAYLLTGAEAHLHAAAAWSMASCGYPTWGTGVRDGVDLSAGHQLFGLALVYDWLYDALPPEIRSKIRETLLTRGDRMYQAARDSASWKRNILQNHLWVNLTGLTAASLALREPVTEGWTTLARAKFRETEANLGPDGASQEGVPYWTYGMEYMLKFWHLAGDAWGEKPRSVWWNNTAAYRLYLGLPRQGWRTGNTLVDISDGPRSDYYGPDYLLRRLAARYRDPHAQWLVGELDRAGVTNYAARWLNLLWFDPTVEEKPPGDSPTLRHFSDIGIVSARSSWSGDESLVAFKCGPPLGHAAVGKFDYDPGCGHVHPDANHFVLFGRGEWLLRDDGYAWKQTDQHNTLLIDGAGQLGEGSKWFRGMDAIRPRANPRILSAISHADYDEMIAEAAPVYPAAFGLKSFRRRLLFWKPDIMLVLDEIETERPRQLELRFHPEYPVRADGDSLVARGKKASLRLALLTPRDVVTDHGMTPAKSRSGDPTELVAVRFQTTASRWSNVVALCWSDVSSAPPVVTGTRNGEGWTFRSGGRELRV